MIRSNFIEFIKSINHLKMSIGSVYETAYRGDFNQVKVKVDEDNALINTPDSVSFYLLVWGDFILQIISLPTHG